MKTSHFALGFKGLTICKSNVFVSKLSNCTQIGCEISEITGVYVEIFYRHNALKYEIILTKSNY